MRLRSSTSSMPDSGAIAGRVAIGAASVIGLVALTLGNSPAIADEADEIEQTAAQDSGSDQLSERQRRREERRQAREAEESLAAAPTQDEKEESAFVVYVEPELECRNVAVTGSRMPKRVCTPVGQAAQDEENAQEFLRRTRELSTIVPPEDTSSSDPFRF